MCHTIGPCSALLWINLCSILCCFQNRDQELELLSPRARIYVKPLIHPARLVREEMALLTWAQGSHFRSLVSSPGLARDPEKMSKNPLILPFHGPCKNLLNHWAQTRSPPESSVEGMSTHPHTGLGNLPEKVELPFVAGNGAKTKLTPPTGEQNFLVRVA